MHINAAGKTIAKDASAADIAALFEADEQMVADFAQQLGAAKPGEVIQVTLNVAVIE